MSAYIEDGGPAFPTLDFMTPERVATNRPGMTLRDYCAAKVIGSVIENCKGDTRKEGESQDSYFARIAYQIADAMLAAREAKS